MIILKEGHL